MLAIGAGGEAVVTGEEAVEIGNAREAAAVGDVACRIGRRGEQQGGFLKPKRIDIFGECLSCMFFDKFAKGRLVHVHICGGFVERDVLTEIALAEYAESFDVSRQATGRAAAELDRFRILGYEDEQLHYERHAPGRGQLPHVLKQTDDCGGGIANIKPRQADGVQNACDLNHFG